MYYSGGLSNYCVHQRNIPSSILHKQNYFFSSFFHLELVLPVFWGPDDTLTHIVVGVCCAWLCILFAFGGQQIRLHCPSYIIHSNIIVIAKQTNPPMANGGGGGGECHPQRVFLFFSGMGKEFFQTKVLAVGTNFSDWTYCLCPKIRQWEDAFVVHKSVSELLHRVSKFDFHFASTSSAVTFCNCKEIKRIPPPPPGIDRVKISQTILRSRTQKCEKSVRYLIMVYEC